MYYALTMTDKIGDIDGFDTEAELDTFASKKSNFSEQVRLRREAEGNDYGPPVVFAFVAPDLDEVVKNNFDYPLAVYLRGRRYDCVPRE